MKLVIYPAVDAERLTALQAAAPEAEWVNAATAARGRGGHAGRRCVHGQDHAGHAERGPIVWRGCSRSRPASSTTCFPRSSSTPACSPTCAAIFGDVIADQVMGYVLCFARNLHTYIRQQVEHRYEPAGGESARVSNMTGPGTVNAMDRATIYLPDATMGIVGMGGIGCEIARRALAFGMSVRGVDRFPERCSPSGRGANPSTASSACPSSCAGVISR